MNAFHHNIPAINLLYVSSKTTRPEYPEGIKTIKPYHNTHPHPHTQHPHPPTHTQNDLHDWERRDGRENMKNIKEREHYKTQMTGERKRDKGDTKT